MEYFPEFVLNLQLLGNLDVSIQDGNSKYVYNTEQLTRKVWRDKINNMKSIILDYSEENMKFIENKKIFFPILYQPRFIFEKQEKIYDVAFIGTYTPRRYEILSILMKLGLNVKIINEFDFVKKNIEILKSKVLINIHAFDDYKIMEFSRCSVPVFNSQIVISENVLDEWKNKTINDYVLSKVIFVEYTQLINKVVEVLDNFEKYKYESNKAILQQLTEQHLKRLSLIHYN